MQISNIRKIISFPVNSNTSVSNATIKDRDLVFVIKKNSLQPYIAQIWGWDEEDQINRHRSNFSPENILIIKQFNNPIGIIEIIEYFNSIELINIELINKYQNLGIGGQCLDYIQSYALQKNKPVKLRVLSINKKAYRFYSRKGFIKTEILKPHIKMIWTPQNKFSNKSTGANQKITTHEK